MGRKFPGMAAREKEIAVVDQLRADVAAFDEAARKRDRDFLAAFGAKLEHAPRTTWQAIALNGQAQDVRIEFPAQVVYVVNNSTAAVTVQAPGDPVTSPSIAAGSTGFWLCPGATQISVNGTGTGRVSLRFLNDAAARLQWTEDLGASTQLQSQASFYNVTDFGAVGNGSTDSTTAFANAITAAVSSDGAVFVPAGTYLVHLNIPVDAAGLVIFGVGRLSVLKMRSTDMDLISFAGSSSSITSTYVTIRDLTLDGSAASSGNLVTDTTQDRLTLQNLYLTGVPTYGVSLNGASASALAYGNRLIGCRIDTGSGTAGVYIQQYAADTEINNLTIDGSSKTLSYGVWLNACAAVYAHGGHWSNCATNALRLTGVSSETLWNGIVFDAAAEDLVYLDGSTTAIYNTEFVGCMFAAIAADYSGIHAEGSVYNTEVTGPVFWSSATKALATVYESASTATTVVRGGLVVDGANFTSTGDLQSASSYIVGLINHNPLGLLSAPTMPASGTSQVNWFHTIATVYVSGGTVSGIAVDGTATGLTSGSFTLFPNQTITITYTATPSWVWIGE